MVVLDEFEKVGSMSTREEIINGFLRIFDEGKTRPALPVLLRCCQLVAGEGPGFSPESMQRILQF